MLRVIGTGSRILPRRRSLLLLGCLCAGLAVGGCGGASSGSEEQKQAIMKLQDVGGRVNFKRGGYQVDLTGTGVGDADLASLSKISNLKNVDLQGTQVSDEGLVHLQTISSLERVTLQRTLVTAEGAANLQKMLPKVEVVR